VADTRGAGGQFGGPSMAAGSARSFPIPQSSCGIPGTAQAYALNVTVVPAGPLGYLTLWPTGQGRPLVSTLNSFAGNVVANAAIVPAGTGGAVSVFVSDQTDVVLDINGYFDSTGTRNSFYPATPCRIADTRGAAGQFGGPSMSAGQSRDFRIPSSTCAIPATATAYSLNVTAVPDTNFLGYLSTWPTGSPQPLVSTLNSWTGKVVANAAIVPAGTSGSVSVFVTDPADVILDIDGYFGPPGGAGELALYPVTPCRVADTRNPNGPFGGPEMGAGSTRSFAISASGCSVPSTAAAYSVNVTVVPDGVLSYLTAWPAGSAQPFVSTLNSLDGAVVANAAIVPVGANGAISVYVTNPTHVIVDINGYFGPPPPDQRTDLLLSRMTLDEKIQLVHGNLTIENPKGPRNAPYWVPGILSLGIPDLLAADGPTGVGDGVGEATALPSSIASAASWDLDEAYKYGQVIGKETSAFGLNVNLGGNVNLIGREPRDGRTFETKGEDPLLAGKITAAHARAIQDQYVIAGVKHYALNDQETARTQSNAVIDERSARESDLLAFEIGIKDSNAQMVMCAYNSVNGAASCGNDHLLNGVLKGDWEFPGFVLSDAYATPSSVAAAMAGLDQEQPGNYMFGGIWTPESLAAAVANGDLPLSRLNDMVHRILRAMYAAGLFDHPATVQPIDAAGDAAVAQEIEEQGAVLLKNAGGQLPLNPSNIASIAVIGSHADVGVLSGGGSAQVVPVGGAALTLPPACPPYTPPPGGQACTSAFQVFDPSSPLAAIRAKAPGATVTFNDGTDSAAAAALAASSSVAVVFVSQWESEGMELQDLGFSGNQDALVAAVARANPHTIVVLENGGAQLVPWHDSVSAVLEAWYPGQRGGEAIANILFGAVNPSGKLPITFPRSVADLPRPAIPIPSPPDSTAPFNIDYTIEGFDVGYKWYDSKGLDVLFPFGYGLSYTTFSISNLQLKADLSAGNLGFQVSFNVQNTGSVAGAEVAQVYLGLPAGIGEPPKRLVGWQKVLLEPGQQQSVTVNVSASSSAHPLSYWDVSSNAWLNAPGDYTVYVGNSSRSVAPAGIFHLDAVY
jgi:beta-glucosidase